MDDNTRAAPAILPEDVRRLAALGGLALSPEQAAALAPALAELLAVDAAIAALRLGALPAAGLPWGEWGRERDRR